MCVSRTVDGNEGTCDVIYEDNAEEDGLPLSRVTPAPPHLPDHHHHHHNTMRGACYANLARCLLRLDLPVAAAAAATHALRAGTSLRTAKLLAAAECAPGHTTKPHAQTYPAKCSRDRAWVRANLWHYLVKGGDAGISTHVAVL